MKDQTLYLKDAIELIEHILSRLQNVDEPTFKSNCDLQDSIVLQIIYLGEALNRTSQDFRNQHPNIPWFEAIGMRHRLAHDYGNVDIDQVWLTVREDLPLLLRQLKDSDNQTPSYPTSSINSP